MSKENKTIVAEPTIPYGKQSWFQPEKNEFYYLFETKSIPYSGNSVHYETKLTEEIWKANTEEHLHRFGIIFISHSKEDVDKVVTIQQVILKGKAFEYFMNEWRANRNSKSSFLKSLSDRNYQNIIQMGKDALPFIFSEMKKQPDDWFDALYEITGDDPIPEKHYGNFIEMTNDWLKWAQVHNYL